jgi:hypothetical protein
LHHVCHLSGSFRVVKPFSSEGWLEMEEMAQNLHEVIYV